MRPHCNVWRWVAFAALLCQVLGDSTSKGPTAVTGAVTGEGWRAEAWYGAEVAQRKIYRFRGGCLMKDGSLRILGIDHGPILGMLIKEGIAPQLQAIEKIPADVPKVDGDLVFSRPGLEGFPRRNPKHFLGDFLAMLAAVDVSAENTISEHFSQYNCEGSGCPEAPKEVLKPVFVLPDWHYEALRTATNRTFSGLLLSGLGGRVALTNLSSLVDNQKQGACFNSIIFFAGELSEPQKNMFTSDHFFWRNLGMTRDPKPMSQRLRYGKCVVKVEVASKRKTSSLANIYHLEGRTRMLLREKQNIDVDFNVGYYEDRSANYQAYKIHDADIFIAPFDDLEVGMFFMREGSTVMEIFPAGQSQTPFESSAKVLGLNFKSLSSLTMPKSFVYCVKKLTEDQIHVNSSKSWYDSVRESIQQDITAKTATPFPNSAAKRCVEKSDIATRITELAQSIASIAEQQCIAR